MISESQALEAYTAVEAAYTQQLWSEVLGLGQALREALDADDDLLLPRLLLLEGHALLHGYADAQAAGERYRRVLGSADASLRQLAEEAIASLGGLQPDLDPASDLAPPAERTGLETGSADSFPFTATAVGVAPAAMADAAMPWLDRDEPQPVPMDVVVVNDPLPVQGSGVEPQEEVLEVAPVQPPESAADLTVGLAEGLLRVRFE
ncbi:MAG: hypothetical protein VKN13_05905 [Cyanobacteriota bacterium]|nr:hypothetical protein [Cyanobacteriota bacterium]